ncbi:hypothetical protein HMI54_005142 [Coelomomyces lativittatus]|nr:hypothetical protein HMI56_004162 [Coelomomyces lativittatus]KAJ1509044.1 hypothetical protein HMI55_000119 [Coelomomyces lativittatus]KAJ1517576.1 hypothetical protein HMI54_005142 [Coelomomyces lativittatus]
MCILACLIVIHVSASTIKETRPPLVNSNDFTIDNHASEQNLEYNKNSENPSHTIVKENDKEAAHNIPSQSHHEKYVNDEKKGKIIKEHPDAKHDESESIHDPMNGDQASQDNVTREKNENFEVIESEEQKEKETDELESEEEEYFREIESDKEEDFNRIEDEDEDPNEIENEAKDPNEIKNEAEDFSEIESEDEDSSEIESEDDDSSGIESEDDDSSGIESEDEDSSGIESEDEDSSEIESEDEIFETQIDELKEEFGKIRNRRKDINFDDIRNDLNKDEF